MTMEARKTSDAKEVATKTAEVLRPSRMENMPLPRGTDGYNRINRAAETWVDKKIVSLKAAVPVRLMNFAASKAHGWNDEALNLKGMMQDFDQQISALKIGDLRAVGFGGNTQENRRELNRLESEKARLGMRYNKAEEKTRTWTGRQDTFEGWTRRQTDPFIEQLNTQREPFDRHARALGARAIELQNTLQSVREKRQNAIVKYEEKLAQLQGAMSPENEKRFREAIIPAFQMVMARFNAEEKNAVRAKEMADGKLNMLRKAMRPLERHSKNTALWIHAKDPRGVENLPAGLKVSAPGRLESRSLRAGGTGLGPEAARRRTSLGRGIDAAPASTDAPAAYEVVNDDYQISYKELIKAWGEVCDTNTDVNLDDRKLWDLVFDARGITNADARDAEYQKVLSGDEKLTLRDIKQVLVEASGNPNSPLHGLASSDEDRENVISDNVEIAASYSVLVGA